MVTESSIDASQESPHHSMHFSRVTYLSLSRFSQLPIQGSESDHQIFRSQDSRARKVNDVLDKLQTAKKQKSRPVQGKIK